MRNPVTFLLAFLLCTSCAGHAPKDDLSVLVITDVGTDVDDAEALTLAFSTPNLHMAGVACTADNRAHRLQILRTLASLVAEGMEQEREPERARAVREVPCGEGTSFIDSVLSASKKPLTVVLLAQATHLAEALQHKPSLAQKIDRVYFQGQAFCDSLSGQLRPNQQAFNVSEDSTAAAYLFGLQDRIPFVLVGKYAVYPLALTRETVEAYNNSGKPVGKYLYLAAHQSLYTFAHTNPQTFAKVYHIAEDTDLSTPQAIDDVLSTVPTLTNPYDAVALMALLYPQYFDMQHFGIHLLVGQTSAHSGLKDTLALQQRLARLLD